ncbi:MAG: 2-amino-4-oxopentanoate thiolase subunit OrtA [Clostridia bacterium]|nr:2-amino-4-oxopentanoate thiolase subunit OrtA [Clostridia bacterium]
MAKKGDWVSIHVIVLKPEQRALSALPEDTRQVPLEMWVKGCLNADAEIGGEATVTTRTGREVSGRLVEVEPCYTHSFGAFVPELQTAGDIARRILFGGET